MGKLTHWAATFAVIAAVSGILGYGELAGTASPVAKLLFWFSIGVAGLSLAGGMVRRT